MPAAVLFISKTLGLLFIIKEGSNANISLPIVAIPVPYAAASVSSSSFAQSNVRGYRYSTYEAGEVSRNHKKQMLC